MCNPAGQYKERDGKKLFLPRSPPINYYSLCPFLFCSLPRTVVLLHPQPRWPAYRNERRGRNKETDERVQEYEQLRLTQAIQENLRTDRIETGRFEAGGLQRRIERWLWDTQERVAAGEERTRGRVSDSSIDWTCHICFGQRDTHHLMMDTDSCSLTSVGSVECWTGARCFVLCFHLLMLFCLSEETLD